MRITVLGAGLVAFAISCAAHAAVSVHLIKPSAVDPAVKTFDQPNVALYPSDAAADAPLVIFMPGTHGKPDNVMPLLRTIAAAGLPTIGLEYPDEPAVVQVCVQDPDPGCSAAFRQVRVYGLGASKYVANGPADSIRGRLSALLGKLAKDNPGEAWGRYLSPDGSPLWQRIVVSGQSQGAGMAAFIAKATPVARVVLFSSPWDYQAPPPRLAPWIAGPSATPPDRWYGAYNRREKTAALLAQSYKELGLTPDHIRVLTLDLPAGAREDGSNPYHPQGVHDPRYAAEWRFLYGLKWDAPSPPSR